MALALPAPDVDDDLHKAVWGGPRGVVPFVICHEDGTTGWPVTMDHLFGSLGMIGGRQAGVNRGFLSASVGLAFDDEFVCR